MQGKRPTSEGISGLVSKLEVVYNSVCMWFCQEWSRCSRWHRHIQVMLEVGPIIFFMNACFTLSIAARSAYSVLENYRGMLQMWFAVWLVHYRHTAQTAVCLWSKAQGLICVSNLASSRFMEADWAKVSKPRYFTQKILELGDRLQKLTPGNVTLMGQKSPPICWYLHCPVLKPLVQWGPILRFVW